LSIDQTSAIAPVRGTRPNVGRRPVTPFVDDGDEIEPSVSVPMANPTQPAAVAEPGPAASRRRRRARYIRVSAVLVTFFVRTSSLSICLRSSFVAERQSCDFGGGDDGGVVHFGPACDAGPEDAGEEGAAESEADEITRNERRSESGRVSGTTRPRC